MIPIVAKVLERIVYEQLYSHLEDHDILCQKLQNRAARVLTFSNYDAAATELLEFLGWKILHAGRKLIKPRCCLDRSGVNLKCLVANCRSVKNKIADIAVLINEHKPDIVFRNESWLKPDIKNSEIFPDSYKIYRKDRDNNGRGGGVFQAIKNDLIITHHTDWDSGCEIVWSQCQLAGVRNVKSIYFGSYYRPNKSDLVSVEELNVSLLKMGTTLHKNNVILAGDFNAPDVDWTSPLDSDKLTFASKKLLEVFDDHDLNQFVKEPTRRQGDSQHILDLVLSNNKDIISRVKVIDGISDHDIVLFNVRASCQRKRNVKRKVYIKKKADCQRIKRELQSLAEAQASVIGDASVDEKWNYFEENIRRIMDTCIPHKMTSSRYNLPWFDRSLRRQTRAKQRLYNKAKKSRNPAHWSEYRAARKRTQKNLKSAREVYISDFLGDAIEENPKRFWSYIKQLRNDDPGVADFKIDNRIISDGKAKSELLSEQFSSVFTVEDLTDIPVAGRDPKPGISSLTVTIPGVIRQLQSLKPNKASGPDGIPP